MYIAIVINLFRLGMGMYAIRRNKICPSPTVANSLTCNPNSPETIYSHEALYRIRL
uniref:Uncharacterized protein n=1 Tax=uncultured Desulfobacterium sp. TaxID=201089 RepID=E1YD51_9BACT|nr:unknown protein [uncultured Desulfobacterium sp.]